MSNYLEKLNNLTEEERKVALQILREYSTKGSSDKYNELKYQDYKEIPVDIETFLHDKKYLGKGLTDEEGRFTLFPYWEEKLKEIFPNPLKPAKYNTAIFTGAIGLGKSTIAVITGCYELYRMLCLKNPYVYYGLQEIDLITFAVINITIDAAQGVAWSKMQSLLKSSQWFLDHGTLNKANDPEWLPPAGIELIYGSKPSHIIGRALFWCFQDEVSFRQTMDVEKQKKLAQELVSSASARMQSRFMKGNINPTLLVLASSKRTEQSYLESFIKQKQENESKTTLVVDEPQWIIRTDKNTEEKFKVAIGNKYLDSEILPLNISQQDLSIYRDRGFKILDVPIGYYEAFKDDINIALTDIAGISTTSTNKYLSGTRIAEIKNRDLKNPFTKEILVIGDAREDIDQYYNYFNIENIPASLRERPLFIHLDMSMTGDKTGIAGVFIKSKEPPKDNQPASKELHFQLGFSVAIKAPKGHQISFEKNRQFIYWLKEQGFNIRGISSDTFQSADMNQSLTSKGYNYSIISVDRVDQDHICKPYQYLKSTIYEKRLTMYDAELLTDEWISLERNNNSGKVDHPQNGSKDISDAVCGAIWNASQHADEFAFEYGETLESITQSNDGTYSNELNQVTVDFEEELKKAFSNFHQPNPQPQGMDFGMGVAQPVTGPLIANGIMVW